MFMRSESVDPVNDLLSCAARSGFQDVHVVDSDQCDAFLKNARPQHDDTAFQLCGIDRVEVQELLFPLLLRNLSTHDRALDVVRLQHFNEWVQTRLHVLRIYEVFPDIPDDLFDDVIQFVPGVVLLAAHHQLSHLRELTPVGRQL